MADEEVLGSKIRFILLYKKKGEGEEVIAVFKNYHQAFTYSNQHKLMSHGWIARSLRDNTYPYFRRGSSPKYPYATEYRFEYRYIDVHQIFKDLEVANDVFINF